MTSSILRLIADIVAGLIGILMAGGFALAYAARYVPPTRLWWLQILGPLLPVFVGLIIGALVVSLISRHWVFAGLFAVCLALFAFRHLTLGFLTAPSVPGNGDVVTVMSFNGRLIVNLRDAEAAAQEFRPIYPDLIAMQESPVRAIPNEDGTFMARQVRLMINSTGTGLPEVELSQEGHQLPILSKQSIHPTIEELHSSEGNVLATRSEFEHGGRRYAIYNTHLHSFRRDGMITDAGFSSDTISVRRILREDFLIRMNEAVELRRILDGETLPFILCADLNSTPDNWIYRYISRGLTDAQRRAGKGFGGTFPSPLPLARIDYIFFSRHWDVHDAQALPIIMSDHRPVVARASLRSD